MSVTVDRIAAGPARIFVGVTVGVTGTPPTYITHTDGVPGTGTDIGATQGESKYKLQISKKEIFAEQSLAPIAVWTESELAEVTFTALEHTYVPLQWALDNVGKEDVAAGEAFYFGNGTGILAPTTGCVMMTTRIRTATTKFIVGVLYKAYIASAFEIGYSKAGESKYQVTLKGLADLTRNAGDQVGYYRYETAA